MRDRNDKAIQISILKKRDASIDKKKEILLIF